MEDTESARVAANLRMALELHEFGVVLYAQRLRRESPHASEDEIRAAVVRWLREPALPHRDAGGLAEPPPRPL